MPNIHAPRRRRRKGLLMAVGLVVEGVGVVVGGEHGRAGLLVVAGNRTCR